VRNRVRVRVRVRVRIRVRDRVRVRVPLFFALCRIQKATLEDKESKTIMCILTMLL